MFCICIKARASSCFSLAARMASTCSTGRCIACKAWRVNCKMSILCQLHLVKLLLQSPSLQLQVLKLLQRPKLFSPLDQLRTRQKQQANNRSAKLTGFPKLRISRKKSLKLRNRPGLDIALSGGNKHRMQSESHRFYMQGSGLSALERCKLGTGIALALAGKSV